VEGAQGVSSLFLLQLDSWYGRVVGMQVKNTSLAKTWMRNPLTATLVVTLCFPSAIVIAFAPQTEI